MSPISYVLTVEELPNRSPQEPDELAQYIRLRLDSQKVIQVVNITGIKDVQDE